MLSPAKKAPAMSKEGRFNKRRWKVDKQAIGVRVRVAVNRVLDVNLVAQTFTVNMQLEASWVDPEHKPTGKDWVDGRPNRYPVKEHPLGKWDDEARTEALQRRGDIQLYKQNGDKKEIATAFAPRLRFSNAIDEKDSEMWYVFYEAVSAKSEPQLIVCLRWSATITFQTRFNLKEFPLDRQPLIMELRSNQQIADESKDSFCVRLKENTNPEYRSFCNTANFALDSSYALDEIVSFESDETGPHESAQQAQYSVLRMTLEIERQPHYWVNNVFFPMFVIVSSGFASFFVPRTELADRSSITVTLLLALVAFKLVIADKLPHLSYSTHIDRYVVLCFVMLAMMIFWQAFAAVGLLPEEYLASTRTVVDPAGESGRVEIPWLGIGGFVVWLLAHVLAYVSLRFRRPHVHSDLQEEASRALYLPLKNFPDAAGEQQFKDGVSKKTISKICEVKRVVREDGTIVQPIDAHKWTPESVEAAFKKMQREVPYPIHSNFVIAVFKNQTDLGLALNSFGGKRGGKVRLVGASGSVVAHADSVPPSLFSRIMHNLSELRLRTSEWTIGGDDCRSAGPRSTSMAMMTTPSADSELDWISSINAHELKAEPLDVRFGVLVRHAQIHKSKRLLSLRSMGEQISHRAEQLSGRQRSPGSIRPIREETRKGSKSPAATRPTSMAAVSIDRDASSPPPPPNLGVMAESVKVVERPMSEVIEVPSEDNADSSSTVI